MKKKIEEKGIKLEKELQILEEKLAEIEDIKKTRENDLKIIEDEKRRERAG